MLRPPASNRLPARCLLAGSSTFAVVYPKQREILGFLQGEEGVDPGSFATREVSLLAAALTPMNPRPSRTDRCASGPWAHLN
jgi:hypothetical protein